MSATLVVEAGFRSRTRLAGGNMDDEAKQRRLANLRPFRPGQSGTPGGCSEAQIDVRNAARAYTQEAIDTLVLVMRNGKPGEAEMAANSLLDRGWGKPNYSEPLVSESASGVVWDRVIR
jgi:hypothetical protein